jgi:hypothetical protein
MEMGDWTRRALLMVELGLWIGVVNGTTTAFLLLE